MRRWVPPLLLFAVLAAALLAQAGRALEAVAANRLLWQVKTRTEALARTGRLPAAAVALGHRELRHAERLDPGEIAIRAAEGDLHFLVQRWDSAIRAYERALELEPRAEVHLRLGLALWRTGRTEAALPHLHRALVVNPRYGWQLPPEALAALPGWQHHPQRGAIESEPRREVRPPSS